MIVPDGYHVIHIHINVYTIYSTRAFGRFSNTEYSYSIIDNRITDFVGFHCL